MSSFPGYFDIRKPEPPASPEYKFFDLPSPQKIIIPAGPPVDRQAAVDVTGYYESVPLRAGENSAIMLQIAQAGKIVVGWFTPPPSWMPNRSDTKCQEPAKNAYSIQPGVLWGWMMQPLDKGVQFFWINETGNMSSPEALLQEFRIDPPDIYSSNNAKEGILKVIFLDGEVESLYLSFVPSASDMGKLQQSPTADRFIRTKTTARSSNFLRQWLPRQMQEYLLAEQICPLPSTYTDIALSSLAPFDNTTTLPPVTALINEWRTATDKPTRKIKREKIGNILSAVLLDKKAFQTYQVSYGMRIRAHIYSRSLVVKDEKKTYLQWYQAVLGEELDEREELQKLGKNTDNIISPLVETCRQLGIAPARNQEYAYTLNFKPMSVPGLGALSKKPGFSFLAHVGITGFLVTIKKERVTYITEADGSTKRVNGIPVVASRTPVWDTSSIPSGGFAGAYGDVGAGISFGAEDSLDSDKGVPVDTKRISGESKTKKTGELKGMEFRSSISIDKPTEFEYARFSIAAVRAPGIAVGNFGSIDLFSSKYIEFRLSNNIILSTVEENSLKLTPPSVPGAGNLFNAGKYIKDWKSPKASARLLDISVGWGIILTNLPSVMKPVASDRIQYSEERDKKVKAYKLQEAFFKVDSANLDQTTALGSFPPRVILETFLACERALFTNGDALIRAFGYTSPEHTAAHNLELSQKRADAVVQGIKDAFGNLLRVTSITAKGLGEEAGLRSDLSLLNPPDPIGNWATSHPEQVKKWPDWRKVDIEVEGIVVARFQDR
ncbi:MAG: hypothetical protein ABWZ25_16970 [Chitinophagaceae bacterium]